jgi:hypothetical protein
LHLGAYRNQVACYYKFLFDEDLDDEEIPLPPLMHDDDDDDLDDDDDMSSEDEEDDEIPYYAHVITAFTVDELLLELGLTLIGYKENGSEGQHTRHMLNGSRHTFRPSRKCYVISGRI